MVLLNFFPFFDDCSVTSLSLIMNWLLIENIRKCDQIIFKLTAFCIPNDTFGFECDVCRPIKYVMCNIDSNRQQIVVQLIMSSVTICENIVLF